MQKRGKALLIAAILFVCGSATAKSWADGQQKIEDCGCEVKIKGDAAAIVNGAKITPADLDDQIRPRIDELQQQVVETRKRELNKQIDARLLQAEARRQGTTPEKLAQQVSSGAKDPTDAEVAAFYEQNKDRIQGTFEDLKPSIIGYIREQRRQELVNQFTAKLRSASQTRILVQNVTPPQTPAERARVLATVNGQSITSGDIEDALRPIIFETQEQVYELRRGQLDSRINALLLEQEAARRNLSPDALYQLEIAPLIHQVGESEARKFYEENRDRIQGGYVQVREQVLDYLQAQEQTKAALAFANKLRATAKIQDFLLPPTPPAYQISIEDRPMKGNPNASVTMVEFTDFQCPSCGATQPVIEEVMKELGDKVRLVVRNFPLDQHANAEMAAEAAEAARAQGKYWEYIAVLFQNQNALEVPKLKEYAGKVGLDRAAFDRALDTRQYADVVKRDLRDGNSVGVGATPTIFVNGRKVRDKTAEGLKSAILAALKEPAPTDAQRKP